MNSQTQNQVTIRTATEEDMTWVNNQYLSIGFKLSDFERELIAIAEVNGEQAGLGRLQYIDKGSAELGGMYVHYAFRGLGVAGRIVDHLVKNAAGYQKIYCLPFAHLQAFYQKFGFAPEQELTKVPRVVLEKHNWCNSSYAHKTLLFSLTRDI
ncbi:GNAT family N-acetyltransferase [Thalassomonas haliotis]|uniref:GNAT family N-acetyltransferase n=1 Tax=Thalassomonas haliotis TaxID=485448 RepID=A0ABY7VJ94_9GAMM|nr:GNAT family N-acetyltransferase [Thalassomonas haliotis]WDE13814.1 GNAT family N-acetyltransferase [Thalassomonas haliotis]